MKNALITAPPVKQEPATQWPLDGAGEQPELP
jgi:hypothetical protein